MSSETLYATVVDSEVLEAGVEASGELVAEVVDVTTVLTVTVVDA